MAFDTAIAAEAMRLCAAKFKRPDYRALALQIQKIMEKGDLSPEEIVERVAERAKQDAA